MASRCGRCLAVTAAAGIAVAVAVAGDDEPGATAGSTQLAELQRCQDWMADRGSIGGADTTWCSDMAAWMEDEIRDGHMMGCTMWGDPQRMLDTCTRWMDTGPAVADGTDPGASCADMVTWMDQHIDDWGDRMHGEARGSR